MTALTFAATRSPSYPNTTLPDATPDRARRPLDAPPGAASHLLDHLT
jgi:hypothetical protein